MNSDLFPGFHSATIETRIGPIFVRFAGGGPSIVLLHGFPQTHACWHGIAPSLSSRFTVVCMDIRGYGSSVAPRGDGRNTYSKREMANDVLAVMRALGHRRFSVVGHDRGARVGYRLALDHPANVERLALLDIVPTTIYWQQIRAGTSSSPHWTFLAKPYPEPEGEIAKNPDAYFESLLAGWSAAGDLGAFDARALESYRKSYRDPARIHAFCEDYRAGATADVEADDNDLRDGKKIQCPSLIVWSEYLTRSKATEIESPPAVWRRTFAPTVQDVQVKSGHFVAEEDTIGTLKALETFFAPLRG
jgi:haloacetate dehalogenase